MGVKKRHIAGQRNPQGASRLWGRGPPNHGHEQDRHEETAKEKSMSVHKGASCMGEMTEQAWRAP